LRAEEEKFVRLFGFSWQDYHGARTGCDALPIVGFQCVRIVWSGQGRWMAKGEWILFFEDSRRFGVASFWFLTGKKYFQKSG